MALPPSVPLNQVSRIASAFSCSQPSDSGRPFISTSTSGLPVAFSASDVMMSIGEEDSATVRSLTRVPVTITVSRTLAVGVGGVVWAQATGVARAREMATASRWC